AHWDDRTACLGLVEDHVPSVGNDAGWRSTVDGEHDDRPAVAIALRICPGQHKRYLASVGRDREGTRLAEARSVWLADFSQQQDIIGRYRALSLGGRRMDRQQIVACS